MASKENLKPTWEVAEQWLTATGSKVLIQKANELLAAAYSQTLGFARVNTKFLRIFVQIGWHISSGMSVQFIIVAAWDESALSHSLN